MKESWSHFLTSSRVLWGGGWGRRVELERWVSICDVIRPHVSIIIRASQLTSAECQRWQRKCWDKGVWTAWLGIASPIKSNPFEFHNRRPKIIRMKFTNVCNTPLYLLHNILVQCTPDSSRGGFVFRWTYSRFWTISDIWKTINLHLFLKGRPDRLDPRIFY